MDDEGIICNSVLEPTFEDCGHVLDGKVLRLDEVIENVLVTDKFVSCRCRCVCPLLNERELGLKADDA